MPVLHDDDPTAPDPTLIPEQPEAPADAHIPPMVDGKQVAPDLHNTGRAPKDD